MSADKSVIVVWRPNLADFRHAVGKGWWGTQERIVRSAFLFFVVPGAVFGFLLGGFVPALAVRVAAGAAFGAVCGLVISFAANWWIARTLLNKARLKGDVQMITLNADGIDRVIGETHVRHPWAAVSRVEEDRRLFILHGPSGPVATVEKSGIASQEELLRVRAFLRARKPGRYLGV